MSGKNYAMVINEEIIDVLYNQEEMPNYPPISTGEKIKAIEFNDEEIEIGKTIYDEESNSFINPIFSESGSIENNEKFPISNLDIDIEDTEIINTIIDNYTLELIKANGLL